jgi:sulfatase maturation enzyme AslB (radical SAM superfamily)
VCPNLTWAENSPVEGAQGTRGAFDETVQGLLNLKRFGQRVEILIVLHKETIERLVSTCEFIARNLLFVDHVALMGLEIGLYASQFRSSLD